jgi:putative transposase
VASGSFKLLRKAVEKIKTEQALQYEIAAHEAVETWKTKQAFRYELDPNVDQRRMMAQSVAGCRKVWNWALARWKKQFDENPHAGKERFLKMGDEKKLIHRLSVDPESEFHWTRPLGTYIRQAPIIILYNSIQQYWKARKAGRNVGFPKFKNVRKHKSFKAYGSGLQVDGCRVRIPNIGWVRTKESTDKLKGRILGATISRQADRWYISFTVEREREIPVTTSKRVVGVDLGISIFATISDAFGRSEIIEHPKPLQRAERRLKRYQRQLSCKKRGSKNYRKATQKLARLHLEVSNKRKNFLHEVTTRLAKSKAVIVIEDLKVANMVRNRRLSKAISEQGWGEFRRQLEYKCDWYGSELIVVPQFFPSSKLCSQCGTKKETLTLADRVYRCDACGLEIDRDLNAAINLAQYVTEQTTGNAPVSYACGEDGSASSKSTDALSVEEDERNQLRRTRKEAKDVSSDTSGTSSLNTLASARVFERSTINPCVVGGDSI